MIKPSLKARLITSFTLTILITALVTTIVGICMIRNQVYKQAQSKVNSDLESAKEIYRNYQERLKDSMRIHATRMIVYGALDRNDTSFLGPEMERIQKAERLDILTLTDRNGVVFYRTNNPTLRGDNLAQNEIIQQVLENKTSHAGTAIVSAADMERESEALAAKAYMEIIPTLHASPTEKTFVADGMMIVGAAPVFTADNRMVGVLYGGALTNRNYEIVDKVRKTVFKGEVYKGSEVGTATIFQDDVRISTNVKNKDGTRAINTRVSAEVAESVLKKGNTWQGRAFVVNDWYISAYEPIQDIAGKTIGMLYVGILERPYKDNLWKSLFVFLGISLLGVLLVGWVALIVSQQISKPIRAMSAATKKLAEGDYSHKIEVTSHDEIGHLAASFNRMMEELSRANRELKEWTDTLERKVEQRTAELKAMQQQLIQTEKLAAIGKLAAGVAHEINNPLTGILTNSSLMLEDFPPDDIRRKDLQTIVDETLRCRKIVKGLLDFARQTQPQKQPLSLNQVVEDVLALIRNQAVFNNIKIATNMSTALPFVMADRDQLRQVVLNIVLNAAEAMNGEGRLTLTSFVDKAENRVGLHVKDTGPGISDEIKSKLFEPFSTTKKTGTGLGLSIAYGIIARHKGSISVESAPDMGTTISIYLPIQSHENNAN